MNPEPWEKLRPIPSDCIPSLLFGLFDTPRGCGNGECVLEVFRNPLLPLKTMTSSLESDGVGDELRIIRAGSPI